MRKIVRIKDLGQVVTGSTPPTKVPENFGEGYPFIKPTDLDENIRYVISTETEVSQVGYSTLAGRLIPEDTTCVVCIGTIGKIGLSVRPSFTNQAINSVVVDRSRYDPIFVYYLLRDAIPKVKQLDSGASSGRENVSKSSFENIEVEVPPLEIQNLIADILSAYDDLIENNLRRIKILEEMTQAIYREWFVHFRFPRHEKVKMVDSSLGKIPEGWEVSRLSKLVKTQYGYTESAVESPVGPHFVRGMDINKQTFIDWTSVPYCSISEEEHEEYRLHPGDVLVIRMADPGKVGIVERDIDAIFGSYLIRLRITSLKLSPYFLFYFLLSDRYQEYVTGVSTGTTRKSASAGVLTDIDCVIPLPSLRERFEDIVTLLRHMLNNLLRQNANLRWTRDLLLPKLISGEIGVSELNVVERGAAV